jgi:hypothetical protein
VVEQASQQGGAGAKVKDLVPFLERPVGRGLTLLRKGCQVPFSSRFSLPCAAFPHITNVTEDQSRPTPGTGHDYISFVGDAFNAANGLVSFGLSM